MKKLLALVLALVMTMSLVTISNAAFDDAADIDYAEAVDVMTAVGVLQGDGTGKFLPDGQLTRAAAAKIVAYLIYGNTTAEALATASAPFADVPASHWAAGYISALAADGVVAGVGDNKFAPDADVTALQFAKMLLVALGYDATIEGMVGADWSIKTSKLANKKDIKLFEGNDNLKVNAVATRQEAALYAFNALNVETVEYDSKGTTITVNGATIASGASAAKGTTDLLREELYGTDLKLSPTKADVFKRPANKWTYKADEIGTYSEKAAFTLSTEFNGNELQDAATAAGVAFDTSYTNGLKVVVDGADDTTLAKPADTKAWLDTNAKTDFAWSGKGVQVEAFVNDDDYVTTLVVTNTLVGQVDTIVKDKASTKTVDESAFYIKGEPKVAAEDKVEGFEAVYAGLEEGDYVLYNKVDGDVVAVSLPTAVTGDISSYKADTSVTLGGKVYTMSAKNTFVTEAGVEGATLYLDKFGYAVACDANASEAASLVVLSSYQSLNKDGKLVDMAYVVYADGTTARVETDKEYSADAAYLYDENDDGQIVLSSVKDASKAVTKDDSGKTFNVKDSKVEETAKGLKLYGTTKTYFATGCKFIFVEDGKFTVADSIQDLDTVDAAAVIDADGYISAVYILGASAKNSIKDSSALIFIASEDGTTSKLDKDGKKVTVYAYNAYIDGEKAEGFVADISKASGFYYSEYDSDNGWYILKNNAYKDTNKEIKVAKVTLADEIAADKYIGDDIELVSTTKYASDVEDYTVEHINDLKVLVEDVDIASVDVTVLYDSDAMTALYVYVTAVTEA